MGGSMSYSTADEVKAAANAPGVSYLDVRTEAEVKVTSLAPKPFHNVSCLGGDCTELTAKASTLMPDKNAPVIVFCRSGGRASYAKEALEDMGYTTVLNAGGIDDLVQKLV
jgi:phage shock protein E